MRVSTTHFDQDAAMLWNLDLDVEIDPGQAAVARLDPGRCEPWRARGVDEIRVLGVPEIALYDRRTGASCRERIRVPAPFSEILAREFESRLSSDDQLRVTLETQILVLTA
jgi:hypothetical protein